MAREIEVRAALRDDSLSHPMRRLMMRERRRGTQIIQRWADLQVLQFWTVSEAQRRLAAR
jgi:hypothetical protein